MTREEEDKYYKDIIGSAEHVADRTYIESLFLDYSQKIEKPTALTYEPTDPDKVIVTIGNFSVIRGQAKSYKSSYCVLVCMDFFRQQPDGIVLWIDTEQGDYHAGRQPRRICEGLKWDVKQTMASKRLILAALRKLTTADRMTAVDDMLHMIREDNPTAPLLVILDGARDLNDEANDEAKSRALVDKILAWTADLKLGMLCVIHTRKDGLSSLGHTGAELEKKGEQIIEVSRLQEGGGAKVECLPSRNPEFDSFDFKIDAHGVPYRVNKPEKSLLPQGDTQKETKAILALPIETHTRSEWLAILQGIECGSLSKTTAEKYFPKFVKSGILVADKEETHFSHYLLKGNEPKQPTEDTQQIVPMPTTENIMTDNTEPPF